MKKINYLFAMMFLASGCTLHEQEMPDEISPVVTGADVKTEVVVSLSRYGIREPDGLVKSGNQCLVADRLNSHNLYRIDLQSRQKEGLFPRVRTRSGEAVILHSLTSDGCGGWSALDGNKGCLNSGGVLPTRSNVENSLQLPVGERYLWAVRAGKYVVSTGIYTEGRYMLYSPADGSVSYGVAYPEHPVYPELSERASAVLFASNVLKARPDGDAFVCADMYSGVMDICRIGEGEINLVKRLVYHYPRVRMRQNGHFPKAVYSKDNRFGFTDVCVTNDCIYALYSGQTYRMEKEHFQHCRTLLEIDWNGVVRSTRSIDASLTHLTYDEQEKALYGIAWSPKATLVRLVLD